MITPANRRLYARKVLRRAAIVVLPGGVKREVKTWDLGQDGMAILSPKPISPGTRCEMTLELPQGDRSTELSVPVKVVYCSFSGSDGFKVGMSFGDLDADAAAAIQQFSAAT
ncbi:PilZ domain-containing protein [Piscinibacter sp.]|uniref:PilZ domain-containing protein n=1 Tax=Piscinibacter sp. TaxID=1903157 RepID=UPI002B9CCD0B|nr:PilZ domain-containing protein [Albitalea sp.]HUG23526.1 PilZ domain-containing protein [Albitalea sp.]